MNTYSAIVIFYFSGTGNSKKVAEWFSEVAIKKNMICNIYDISKTEIHSIEPISNNSLIVFISPVHGFNYPKITLRFIKNFPSGKNKVVLMNTRAGMKIGSIITPGITGIAFIISSILLKSKGYKIAGQIPFDMPSNWISIHPALNEKTVRFIHQENFDRVKKHSDKILDGKKDFLALRDLIQDILIAPISLGYFFIGRNVFAKSFYASYKCDNCGICINQCPVKAIKTIKGHPYWTFNCESCMKCMNSCPKRAIETAHGLFVFLAFLILRISTVIITPFLYYRDINGSIEFILINLLGIGFLFLFYYLQHLILKKSVARKLITYTSLTYYKFWGRYKSIPDFKWKKI